MKRNGEQLYYPQSGTEGCRAATIHNVPDPLCILDEKSCSEHVTFSFSFDKNRYYQGRPNPRLEKLRQGKCRVDSE
jgi:hypothetical protein